MNDEKLVLNRYLLQKRIALGGSAEVWHARDRKLNRAVAVKRLHAHLLPDAASRRRLASEARAASRLAHPGIVEIYDVDTQGEMPVLVMELVDGESLAARLDRDGPLPADEAARIAADVGDALYHAHRQGIIHRDVKPGNVLLGRDGSTRLVDFGIAHSLAEAAERLTVAGTVIGTPRYMAPEQLTDGAIGPRTDLFGLGLLLHEMLTGRSPFKAIAPVALAQEQAAGPPSIEGLEPALAEIIRACLAPDPEERPLHAGAVATALRAWRAGDPAPALAVAAGEPAPPPPPAPDSSVDTAAITQPLVAVAQPEVQPPLASGPISVRPRGASPQLSSGAVLAVGVAGVVLALVLLRLASPDAAAAPVPTPTPTFSPTPTIAPTPMPEWMAKLLDEYRKHCGDENVDEVAAAIAGLGEEPAKRYVEEATKPCKEGDRGDGDGNRGGNGGGGGGDD